jgi:hypothetical protein
VTKASVVCRIFAFTLRRRVSLLSCCLSATGASRIGRARFGKNT